jgi:lambda family phage tail tape measure protein
MSKVDALTKSSLTNEQKRAEAIKDYKKSLDDIRKVNPNDSRLDPAAVAKNMANLNDKFKDPKAAAGSVDLTSFNNAKNVLAETLAYYKNADKELEASQRAGVISQASYTEQRVSLLQQEASEVAQSYQSEIDALEAAKAKKGTTAAQVIQIDQKIADARSAMVKAQRDADTELNVLQKNEEGRVKKQTAASEAYVAQLERQRAALEASGTRAANGLGLGDRQQGLQNSLDGATDKFNEERAKLLDRRRTAPDKYSMDDYQKDLANLETAEDRYRATVVGNYDKMSVAQSDWQSGATSAFANYLDSANNVAGQAKSLFTNAFSSMEDAIVNFAMTGKLSFADFAKSILADMARIATRQASSSALSGLFGLAATAASSYFGGGTTSAGSTQAGYTGSDYSNWVGAQAKGGAWSSGVQMFANGGAFTNSIVSKPTAFGMANGKTGVMGEAGEEAIVPLARDSQGRLGIRGGSSATPITMTFYFDAADNGASTIPDPAKLAEAMKVVAQQEIARQRRNGGQLA